MNSGLSGLRGLVMHWDYQAQFHVPTSMSCEVLHMIFMRILLPHPLVHNRIADQSSHFPDMTKVSKRKLGTSVPCLVSFSPGI